MNGETGDKMSNILEIPSLLDLEKTIAADLFSSFRMPWEVLASIREFILSLGKSLSPDFFWHPADDVWIAKTASVAPSASI